MLQFTVGLNNGKNSVQQLTNVCLFSKNGLSTFFTFQFYAIAYLCQSNGEFFLPSKIFIYKSVLIYIVCTYTSFHRDICMDVVKAYSSVSEYIVDFKSSFLSSSPRIHVIWLTLGKFFTKPKPTKKILIFLDDVIFLGIFFSSCLKN